MYRSYQPSTLLEPLVECYWSWGIPSPTEPIDEILPDAAPEFIVHLGAPPDRRSGDGPWSAQPRALLFNAVHRMVELRAEQPLEVFAVRFRPWGASPFLRRPMSGMLDQPVPADAAFGEVGRTLASALVSAAGHEDRVRIADGILTDALGPERGDVRQLERLRDRVSAGGTRAKDLAAAVGMSERSFHRFWRAAVGCEPRRFSLLMRFHRALAMIRSGDPLASVAAACGYSDQAHMARQIRDIAGLAPSRLRARLGSETFRNLYGERPGASWSVAERSWG